MSADAKLIAGVTIATILIVVFAAFTIGNQPSKNSQTQEQRVLGEAQVQFLLRENSHIIKAKDKKVTVVEFGDYQCPACSIAYSVVKQIKDKYKGQVNFVFREFPISSHPNGYSSAIAAEAAGGQGKFWEMHDKLYENQEKWVDEKDPTGTFIAYAKEIGINVERFKADLKNRKYDEIVKRDQADGAQLGVNATPTFFINNQIFPGVIKYDDFESIIDSELKK